MKRNDDADNNDDRLMRYAPFGVELATTLPDICINWFA